MRDSAVSAGQVPIRLLAAAGFLSSSGARIIDPLLAPIALDFRSSIPEVSILIAAFVLPYGLNQIILGPIGDRYGKLRVLLGALTGYVVFTGACATATTLPLLTVFRACAGASSAGLIPICLAYIGDAVPYELRQVTLSRFLTGVVVAQVLAGPLGGVFGDYLGWRGVFIVLAGCGFVVAASLALRIGSLPDRRGPGAFQRSSYVFLARSSLARQLLLATVVEGALLPGSFPFLAPFLSESFNLSFSAVGLILACFGLGAFGYTRWAKSFLDRFGEHGQVWLGGSLIVVSLLVGMLAESWVFFVAVEALLGLGYFTLHTVVQARATELLPDARSTAVSTFVFLLFLGQAIGALALGGAIAAWGYRAAFIGDAVGTALLTLWLGQYIRRTARDVEAATPAPSAAARQGNGSGREPQ